MHLLTIRRKIPRAGRLAAGLLATLLAVVVAQQALAAGAARPAEQPSPLHPAFALLDADGQPVIASGRPLSTMETCGQCHDADYIAAHGVHTTLGEDSAPAGARPWEFGSSQAGRWDPLTYRYLSPAGDARGDLTLTSWLQLFGPRSAGGGAAAGLGAELDCLLCHSPQPNTAARNEALRAGAFEWASTATLIGSGIVQSAGGEWQWQPEAFDAEGLLKPEYVRIQDPANANCAACHGLVQDGAEPLVLAGETLAAGALAQRRTATTGQVVSPQRIAQSGMNLADKDALARSWDVHAERGLDCVDCHYALNNPARALASIDTQPGSVTVDPRRLDLGEYLQRPTHELARSPSAEAGAESAALQGCEGCHAPAQAHDWLPYQERHFDVLACESCHVPQLYAPALESVDWTVLQAGDQPVSAWRGVVADPNVAAGTELTGGGRAGSQSAAMQLTGGATDQLITGYRPALLPREDAAGETRLAPYNLVAVWYWLYDSPDGPRPVRLDDLRAAYFGGGAGYAADVLAAFDRDGDGALAAAELALDSPARQALVAARLEALGLSAPRIAGEVEAYPINHGIAAGDYAIRDCAECHSDGSRIGQAVALGAVPPSGTLPDTAPDSAVLGGGTLANDGGALFYRPDTAGLYVLGRDRAAWADWVGGLAVLGVLGAVALHGGLRVRAALKNRGRHTPALERVYIYGVYERFWHWLQTFAIVLLIFTGLVIHRPDVFGVFSFPYVVTVHNVLAGILLLNAALALFYHLASGEIRQFIPRPYGFFDQAIRQAQYYLRGIFRHEPHPFAKRPEQKLNPLQQITYFGVLNVLLPLQIVTGALMWGVQSWPEIAARLGGLAFLGPFHSLVAWLFAAFVIAHVYLTTTGHEPLASIKAMTLGWEAVESPSGEPAGDVRGEGSSDVSGGERSAGGAGPLPQPAARQ